MEDNEVIPWVDEHRKMGETLVSLWNQRDLEGIAALEAQEGESFPFMVRAMLSHAEDHMWSDDRAMMISLQLDEINAALILLAETGESQGGRPEDARVPGP